MDKLKLIIVREFLAKVRNKTFLVMTILGPLLIIGLGFLIAFLSKVNQEEAKKVAIIDETQIFEKIVGYNNNDIEYQVLKDQEFDVVKELVNLGEYYGVLYTPKQDSIADLASNIRFYSKETPNIIFLNTLNYQVETILQEENQRQHGIDVDKIKKLHLNVEIKLSNAEDKEASKMSGSLKVVVGMVAGYLIMMFIIIYGASVMRSVIEEKTSRIIEVIISSVDPFKLMIGKILGTAGAGLLQFLVWGILTFIIGSVLASFFGLDTMDMAHVNISEEEMEAMKSVAKSEAQVVFEELLNLPIGLMIVSFIIYFVCGYLLYSSIYAAIGAAVDNETDSQQFMFPVIAPLIVGVYVGFATVISDPHGPVSVIFSMIPFTSPIVMLMRIPFDVPMWQIILSIVILIGTFLVNVWFASKIYRVGILMYGKKPSYKDLLKWLKY